MIQGTTTKHHVTTVPTYNTHTHSNISEQNVPLSVLLYISLISLYLEYLTHPSSNCPWTKHMYNLLLGVSVLSPNFLTKDSLSQQTQDQNKYTSYTSYTISEHNVFLCTCFCLSPTFSIKQFTVTCHNCVRTKQCTHIKTLNKFFLHLCASGFFSSSFYLKLFTLPSPCFECIYWQGKSFEAIFVPVTSVEQTVPASAHSPLLVVLI